MIIDTLLGMYPYTHLQGMSKVRPAAAGHLQVGACRPSTDREIDRHTYAWVSDPTTYREEGGEGHR